MIKSEGGTSEKIKEVIRELVKETREKGKIYSLEELLKECIDENIIQNKNPRLKDGGFRV